MRSWRPVPGGLLLGLPLLGLPLSGSALACGLEAVGRIETVKGRAEILRKGTAQPARAYACLFPGDKVRVLAPDARVVFVQPDKPRTVDWTNRNVAVSGSKPAGLTRAAHEFFADFERLLNGNPLEVRAFSGGRGPAPVLAADPLLPAGVVQAVPSGPRRLAAVWREAAADVILHAPDGRILAQADSGAYAHAVLPPARLTGPQRLVVSRGDGMNLVWNLVAVEPGSIPGPPWMNGRTSRTDPERLTRAAWLLREPSARWRLFALSEIAELEGRNYPAARLWRAIRAGELSPPHQAAEG